MAIKCEICDSSNLLKQDGVFVCQDCGARYTTEEIRKMVSDAAPAAPAAAETVAPAEEKKAPEKTEKAQELVQLLEWARDAYRAGNKGAGDTYLDKAIRKNSTDRNVIQMCLDQGKAISRNVLKVMIEETPEMEKQAAYEFAYEIMEKQGMSLGFPFAESDYERLKGHHGTAKYLMETTIPELKMENFWDVDRLLAIHFKSAIQWMNNYKLPKARDEQGLSADANWGIIAGIFSTDTYLQEANALIPSDLKAALYQAFCNACNTVLSGTFYIQVHVGYQCYDYPTVSEDLTVKSYHSIERTQPVEAKRWKEAKEVRAKYEKLLKKIEADAAAAIAAEKAKKNEAYWANYPEEYNQLKSEKLLLETKIKKLQNEYQAAPEKKEMERAQREITKCGWEMGGCGIFQGKRKKELAAMIAELQTKHQEYAAAYEANTKAYERELKDLQNQLAEVNKKLNRE